MEEQTKPATAKEEKSSSNKTLFIVLGIIGAIILLCVICVAITAIFGDGSANFKINRNGDSQELQELDGEGYIVEEYGYKVTLPEGWTARVTTNPEYVGERLITTDKGRGAVSITLGEQVGILPGDTLDDFVTLLNEYYGNSFSVKGKEELSDGFKIEYELDDAVGFSYIKDVNGTILLCEPQSELPDLDVSVIDYPKSRQVCESIRPI